MATRIGEHSFDDDGGERRVQLAEQVQFEGNGPRKPISNARHQSNVPSRVSSVQTTEAGSAISIVSANRVGAEAKNPSSTAGSIARSLSWAVSRPHSDPSLDDDYETRRSWKCGSSTTAIAEPGSDVPIAGEERGPVGITRDQAARFVQAYGRTWESWDFDGFVDLFTDDVIYVEHPTDETIIGRDQMQNYIRAEHDYQGIATVLMGSPIVEGCQVVAEFWATMTKDEQQRTLIGCFIARLNPADGRCVHFRQYWFETPGHASPFAEWGNY